jgi:hypothetical protein
VVPQTGGTAAELALDGGPLAGPSTRRSEGTNPTGSIGVIINEREPGMVQLFAQGIDGSFAAVTGSTTATWWLPVEVARRMHQALGQKLAASCRVVP